MPVSINGQTGVVTGLAALPDSAMASGSIIQVLQVGKTGTTTVQSSGNNVYSDIPNFSNVFNNSGSTSLKSFNFCSDFGAE